MRVIKRDGHSESFNKDNIVFALRYAFKEVYGSDDQEYAHQIMDVATTVVQRVFRMNQMVIDIEIIQDTIENVLMEKDHYKVAKAYMLYREKRAEKRKQGWNMDELQQSIFDKKYKHGDENFESWLDRVSGGDRKVRTLIKDKKFIFAGRILAHRGTKEKVTYSNCYVMTPPADTLEGIFDGAYQLARTYSYGGGCGLDISKLRPNKAKVNNSAKETTGAVSFMKLFDLTTGLIGQNGRRGALMLSIADTHPDLPSFLTVKTEDGIIEKANISVRISRAFMDAVKRNDVWKLHFTVIDTGERIQETLQARDLFRTLCESNWDWAEAGMLYWDRISDWHLMSEHPNHEFAGVNPCAEEPLMEGGSCLLGSMNYSSYVKHPFTKKAYFDFVKFGQDVMVAVEGLNDVLDEGLERHPLQIQRNNARNWRQIGLGDMGIADMLIKLGIAYGSPESDILSYELSRYMLNKAVLKSCMLAKRDGTFPMYDRDALFKSKFFQENIDDDIKELVWKYGLRNSQILTIAPTGSISTMWGISGGIEPIFAISYTRKTESLFGTDVFFEVFTPIIKEYMVHHGITDKKDLPIFITESISTKLDHKDRVRMQGIWQKHIDASISSTVNLPNKATVEDVEEIFMLANDLGLKGITIYRDGCKRSGILTTTPDKAQDVEEKVEVSKEPQYAFTDKFVTCGECGEPIQVITGGCSICMNCGASPCN